MVQDSVVRVEAAVAHVVDSVEEEEEVEMDPHLVSTTTQEAVESAVMVETAKATLLVATGRTGGTAVTAIVSRATEEASEMEWIALDISAMVTDLTKATMAEPDTRTPTEEEEETVITRATTIKVADPSDLIAEENDLPTLQGEISVEDHHEVGPVVVAEEEDLLPAVLVEASIAALPLPPRNKCGTKRTGGCASNVSEFVTFFFIHPPDSTDGRT